MRGYALNSACGTFMSATYKDAEHIVESRQLEIIDAWNNHFGG